VRYHVILGGGQDDKTARRFGIVLLLYGAMLTEAFVQELHGGLLVQCVPDRYSGQLNNSILSVVNETGLWEYKPLSTAFM
jgi:hypothetical protein